MLFSAQYLVVTLGDAKESTPAISKTINPEWNVSFDLSLSGVQILLLEAVCWDKDRFGKDYLGEFYIALEDIFADGKTVQQVCVSAPQMRTPLICTAEMVYLEVGAERHQKEEGYRRLW